MSSSVRREASATELVQQWENSLAQARDTEQKMRADGRWRNGHRTLLAELGVQHHEVILCRALAWLLRPEGWHGLGARVFTSLLTRLDLPSEDAARAVVTLEEGREDARADIVIRYGAHCVLIEAKVGAGEQPTQCDRLADLWAAESPTLVFLTRSGYQPLTAITSRQLWRTLSWADIADIAHNAASEAADPAPGALEFIETLQHYLRSPGVSVDDQQDFYLRHRCDIERWAMLRAGAQQALHDALIAAATTLRDDAGPDAPVEIEQGSKETIVRRRLPGAASTLQSWVELNWERKALLSGTAESAWPKLIVASNPEQQDTYEVVRTATTAVAQQYGLGPSPTRWWAHVSSLVPQDEPIDIPQYAQSCVNQLTQLWASVQAPMLEALEGPPGVDAPQICT